MSFFGKPSGGEPRITYERIDLSANGAAMGAAAVPSFPAIAPARQVPSLRTAPLADTAVCAPVAAKPPAMLIAADSDIEGRLRSRGVVRVEGVLRGELHAASLILEPGGLIEGLVTVDHAQINGTLRGTLVARDIEINRTAVVDAELVYEEIGIERGARVRGLHRRRDPEPAPQPAAVQTEETPGEAPVQAGDVLTARVLPVETPAADTLPAGTQATETQAPEFTAESGTLELAAVAAQTAALVAAAEAALQELSEVAQAAAGVSAELAGEGISGLEALEDELRATPTRLSLAASAA